MKCVVCSKKAEFQADGWSFCTKHYKGFRKYPDHNADGYVRYCWKYEKEKKS